jgi:hypothetical protein
MKVSERLLCGQRRSPCHPIRATFLRRPRRRGKWEQICTGRTEGQEDIPRTQRSVGWHRQTSRAKRARSKTWKEFDLGLGRSRARSSTPLDPLIWRSGRDSSLAPLCFRFNRRVCPPLYRSKPLISQHTPLHGSRIQTLAIRLALANAPRDGPVRSAFSVAAQLVQSSRAPPQLDEQQ